MFTDSDYEVRYKALKEMSIDLDVDPVATGLSSINAKLAEVQALRNRVGNALAEAIRNKSESEISRNTVKSQKEANLARLMMTDELVSGQRSDKLREAAAQTKMPDIVLDLHRKEVTLIKAEAYYKYVYQINGVLEAANYNISRQISVVQMSMQIGELDSAPNTGGTVGVRPAKKAE